MCPALAPGLDAATVAAIRRQGWALVPGYLDAAEVAALATAAARLAGAAAFPPDCRAFFDRRDNGEMRLARLERVAEALPPLQGALGARLAADAARCFDGPAVPFKDKLNLRYPGSAGYAPHQDAARWDRFARAFLSFGLFLSPSDRMRGGFEIALSAGPVGRMAERRGDLIAADYDRLPKRALAAAPGDALLIDGDVPHRTTANASSETILHLLVTFARSDDTRLRQAYYEDQQRALAGIDAGGNRFIFRVR
jgi:hypothetical protein